MEIYEQLEKILRGDWVISLKRTRLSWVKVGRFNTREDALKYVPLLENYGYQNMEIIRE